MGTGQLNLQRGKMVELEIFTVEDTYPGKKTDLKKLMAEKIGPNSLGCSYIGDIHLGSINGETYHCFGATVIVHVDYLSIISEDMPRAHGELEKVLGLPLIFG